MTGRILLVLATIADESGEFGIDDGVSAVKKQYPDITRIYSTSIAHQIHNIHTVGYMDRVDFNRYRIPFSTLDFMESQGFSLERMAVPV